MQILSSLFASAYASAACQHTCVGVQLCDHIRLDGLRVSDVLSCIKALAGPHTSTT